MSKTGIIFDISKYAVHDGPGIRTTVFFKGCPLNCIWCHNPESKKPKPESAANVTQNRPLKTLFCGNKDFIGKEVTVGEVINEIEKDRMFYEQSGGGVTFSGGEPLLQPHFLEELLIECKDRDIKTAVDTSGYASTEIVNRVSAYAGLFLFDLKIMNEQAHIEHTGVSNKIIHENLINLSKAGKSIRIRIPLIPGITDTEININQIIAFLSQLNNIIYVDLLPYNNLSEEKNKRFNSINRLEGLQVQPDEVINKIAEKFAKSGYTITIRG